MRFYFFHNIEAANAGAFRQQTIRQNAVTAKYASGLVAVLSALTALSMHFFSFGRFVISIKEYDYVHNFILFSSIACFITLLLAERLSTNRRYAVYHVVSLLYALFIITGCLALTFIAQHNPTNTITMFMIGLILVGVLWVLNTVQTIVLSIITLMAFSFGLQYFQLDPAKIFPSEIIGTCVVTLFFFISRISFSYHYNNFVQLKNLRAKSDEIAGINKMQTEILAIVAHDLRSPMTNIVGLINLVKDPDINEQERNEMYDMMLLACKETDNIIHDLIDVARKTYNEQLALSNVGLNSFISSVQQQWAHRLPGNRKIIFEKPADEIMVNIHLQKVQRVLDNLINNAIKFTGENGTIKINTSYNGKATICVSDDGVGIPVTLLPYIFERFSRAGRTGLNGEKSYGLGLSICKQIIEAHNGNISAESTEGKGTTFIISLPLM